MKHAITLPTNSAIEDLQDRYAWLAGSCDIDVNEVAGVIQLNATETGYLIDVVSEAREKVRSSADAGMYRIIPKLKMHETFKASGG